MIWNKTEECLPLRGIWVLGYDGENEYLVVRFIVAEEGTVEECPLWEYEDGYIRMEYFPFWTYIPDLPYMWKRELRGEAEDE